VIRTKAQKSLEFNQILNAYEELDFKLVKSLAAQGIRPRKADLMHCYYQCAYYGRLDMLKHLIAYHNTSSKSYINFAANSALFSGQLNIIKYLDKLGAEYSWDAFKDACENGHFEVIKYIINGECYSTGTIIKGLKGSVLGNQLEITKFLLNILLNLPPESFYCDPYDVISDCAHTSIVSHNGDILNLLWKTTSLNPSTELLESAVNSRNLYALKLLTKHKAWLTPELLIFSIMLDIAEPYPNSPITAYILKNINVSTIKFVHLTRLLRIKQHQLVKELTVNRGCKVNKRIMKRLYYVI
jgi:hypothetical protein